MIFKIFSPKNLAKTCRFRLKTKLNYAKIDHNIGFWENGNSFAENRQKSQKIVVKQQQLVTLNLQVLCTSRFYRASRTWCKCESDAKVSTIWNPRGQCCDFNKYFSPKILAKSSRFFWLTLHQKKYWFITKSPFFSPKIGKIAKHT
jgi:hypothetical protein